MNEIWAHYTTFLVLIVNNMKQKKEFEWPTNAFYSVRTINNKGLVTRGFKRILCQVAAYEAEEVGVEHLVREIKDLNMDTLKTKLNNKAASLLALERKIGTIVKYIEDVIADRRKPDPQILLVLHEIISRLPKTMSADFKKTLSENVNDNYLTLFTSSLVKGVIGVHSLLNNRIKNLEEMKADLEKEVKPITAKEA